MVGLREDLQIRDVDGRLRLLRKVVGNQADIGERPAKDIGENEDGSIFGVASDIGLGVSKGSLLTGGRAVPFEAGFAVCARHLV